MKAEGRTQSRPDWAREVRGRLSSLRLSPTREAEIVAELSQHLDDRYRELIAAGASPEEATQLAIAEFQSESSLAHHMAPLRQAHAPSPATPGASTGHMFPDLWKDLRYAARQFRKQPGFAVTTVLTLALGLGSATAIFELVDRLFLRPLPVQEPGRLFNLGRRSEDGRVNMAFSYPEYLDYRHFDNLFEGLVAFDQATVLLDSGNGAVRAQAALVSANFFSVLGVRPILGRTFNANEDEAPGSHPVAVLSYTTWQRLFSSSPKVLGRTVRLNGHSFTVIGVAPKDFSGIKRGSFPALFVPVTMLGEVRPSWTAGPLADRNHIWVGATARLRAGMSAQRAAEAATHRARALTGAAQTQTLALSDGQHGRGEGVESMGSLAWLFSAAALVLLLIVWANVTGLFLARAARRQRETATRLALGASRGRLAAQLLSESFLIALLGGALGLVCAQGVGQALWQMTPAAPAQGIHVRTFVFAWLLMLATTGFVGLIPGLLAARGDILGALKSGGSATSGGRSNSWRRLLAVAQLGLSVVALFAAGLCARSAARLAAVDTGIDDTGVLLATFDVSAAARDQHRGLPFYEALQQRVAALPGIANASFAHIVPFEGRSDHRTLGIPGYQPAAGEDMNVPQNWVGPSYFSTLGVPLLRGREFRFTDRAGSAGVVVVNEALARRFWPGQDPVGKTISYAGPADLEVVGLVKDHRARTPAEAAEPMIYLPYLQRYQAILTLVARTHTEATGVAAAIREAAKSLDPVVAPYDVRTLATEKEDALALGRHATELSSLFGVLCVIVSAVGLYGVMSQAVSQRTREIAIRTALGAARARTMGLVLRDALMLVGLALTIGLMGAFGAGRLLSSMLYEAEVLDLPTAAAVMAILAIVALAAAWLPARRAARVDPIVALRAE